MNKKFQHGIHSDWESSAFWQTVRSVVSSLHSESQKNHLTKKMPHFAYRYYNEIILRCTSVFWMLPFPLWSFLWEAAMFFLWPKGTHGGGAPSTLMALVNWDNFCNQISTWEKDKTNMLKCLMFGSLQNLLSAEQTTKKYIISFLNVVFDSFLYKRIKCTLTKDHDWLIANRNIWSHILFCGTNSVAPSDKLSIIVSSHLME